MALALGGSHRDEDTLSDWEGFSLFLTLLLLLAVRLWSKTTGKWPHLDFGGKLLSFQLLLPVGGQGVTATGDMS